MAFTNYETKEINCKVIYFGPTGSGKTENLRAIYKDSAAEVRSGLLELEKVASTTPFFDFLPLSLGHVRDYHLKLHLFTLPANPVYHSVTGTILKGIDGFVYVADSRIEAMAENIEGLDNVRKLLTESGYNVSELPRVLQYNKRDLEDTVPVDIMQQELNPAGLPDHQAIASQTKGTLETVQSMAKLVIKRLSN